MWCACSNSTHVQGVCLAASVAWNSSRIMTGGNISSCMHPSSFPGRLCKVQNVYSAGSISRPSHVLACTMRAVTCRHTGLNAQRTNQPCSALQCPQGHGMSIVLLARLHCLAIKQLGNSPVSCRTAVCSCSQLPAAGLSCRSPAGRTTAAGGCLVCAARLPSCSTCCAAASWLDGPGLSADLGRASPTGTANIQRSMPGPCSSRGSHPGSQLRWACCAHRRVGGSCDGYPSSLLGSA